jgi:hypothetical protein
MKLHRTIATARQIATFNEYVDILNRQLDEIEKADPDSVVLEKYRGVYYKLEGPASYNSVRKITKSIKQLVKSKQLSLESIERSKAGAIDTLHRDGLDFINGRNFNSYMRFLDDARARHLASVYSSEQILIAINEARRKGLTKAQIRANMDRWAKKAIKYDRQGKQVEIINPPKLNVRRVTLKGKK